MSAHELNAAGITDPALRYGYERCRRLNIEHGKTYYLATLLLPSAKRPYVHALYGFARAADNIVDDRATSPVDRAADFTSWCREVVAELDWGSSSDPVRRALLDTIHHWHIPVAYFAEFLDSMRMDLRVTSYSSFDDLRQYMWGSAAVIGLQMLGILGRADDSIRWDELEPYAIALGIAFQLTNFLRDVGEDLDRGRIYVPQDSLREFGVDRDRLECRVVDEPIRNLMAHEIARARSFYASAEPGVDLVQPTSRDCLRTAITLYRGILDEIERADYDVFSGRIVVPLARRLQVGTGGLVNAKLARRGHDGPTTPSSTTSTRRWRSRTADLLPGRRRSADR